MALLSQQLQRFLLTGLIQDSSFKSGGRMSTAINNKLRSRCCSAIAIDAPSSLTGVSGIPWGCTSLQGLREEMEDDVVIQSDGLDGFSFAAVFDGHGGFSSVGFLRDELFKEWVKSLQGGLLLSKNEIRTVREALQKAFVNADAELLTWLERMPEEDESGSTVTVMFLRNDSLFISHVGDSSVVLSRSGKAEVLTDPHRPYGSSKISLNDIRRIREAGGWVVNGRICGDISVSRAFGGIQCKTKKNELDVEEGS